MSFYNDANIFCGQGNQIDYHQVFKIADLYFCPNCQLPKSKLQTVYKIEQKFCPNCLQDYSSGLSTCSKNCFTCPKCTGHIVVSANDHEHGKSFKFRCTYCPYEYVTLVISKPKSLINIIKHEKLNQDVFSQIFSQFKANFESDKPSKIDKNDKIKENLKLSGLAENKIDKIGLNRDNDALETKLFPLSRKLSSKCSVRCLDCNTVLVSPKQTPPTVNKFDINLLAIDYLPIIKVHPGKSGDDDHIFILSLVNPLDIPMDVQIQWNNTAVTIPTSNFVITPSTSLGSHNLIKQIPTSWLTNKTTVSKAELILRKDHDVQSGNNWYQIPISVHRDEEPPPVKLPLYITISTDIPETLKKYDKSKLNFGYWNIIDLHYPE